MKNKFYPNLFIPGAAKSGTTTLHELLDLHPDISMSSVKEPVFGITKNSIAIPMKIGQNTKSYLTQTQK